MSLHSTLLATWLLGSGLLIVPSSMSAQVPAPDSAPPAAADSQTAPADTSPTTGGAQASSDTVLQQGTQDSASRADSTRAAADSDSTRGTADTAQRPAIGSPTKSDTAPTPTSPPDSILSAACGGPAGPATVARDLLVVVFAPEAGTVERTATAKSVDGTLVGRVTGEPGSYYLRVPSGGGEYRLRAASDQLIQLDMVRQVGSRACPPLPR